MMDLTTTNMPVQQNRVLDVQKKFVTFWIHDELFGVDILDVKEVTPIIEVTPVFHAPKEVTGYVNIRGEIHLVLDLRFLMGIPSIERNAESKIVIFKSSVADPFGIVVDRIGDVLEVSTDLIETDDRTNSKQIQQQLITGVCKLEKQLLILLDARRFLAKN